jgi:HD-GYP domain-containing protein (c-di-GMP phosphodiesterase class II)
VIQLCGPRADDGTQLPRFSEGDVAAARSLAAQAAIAFTNRTLVREFQTLFEGLIELTVSALDAKSAHTGGHCRRVPILAEMLADALCETREGRFAEFSFTPEQRYELHISALLHDFGKIVTPVHVMDKSTKLETIHDRIELVATRYAVAEREAEIASLREQLARAGHTAEPWRGAPDLAEELAFLRTCNRGGETLLPETRERMRAIAQQRRWHMLGGAVAPVLTEEELENLSIARGTLTESERKVIEEHADYTIKLLERLPFPPNLRGVPAIAGSHHERICGGGYPLGLHGEQITLQGRLLGIADVFEALTAPDRPYREPITVSAAIEQLREMVKRGFLDADVFDVFERERVYLRYAREHLRPEQLDDATLDALARLPGGPLPPS